jgi:acetylornithine deacetylase/succinyl-diaminopimelate desuccinylase-like protein
VVDNPANVLVRILTALKGADGRVLIPGFYDDVAALTDDERRVLEELPFDEEQLRDNIGVPALAGESGFGVLERKGARPTFDINGMWSGFQGTGAKTIIPGHAHAKVSCRLVTAQDPDRVFAVLKAFVEDVAPPTVHINVTRIGGGRPHLTPVDHPATRAAARALEATFGRAPVYIREGGSIPVCASIEEQLDLPIVLMGFTPPDDHAHAPNEWMDMANYETAIRTVVRMWDEVAALDRAQLG